MEEEEKELNKAGGLKMGKTTLVINDFEEKKTSANVTYWLFDTSIGKASVWDNKIAEELKKHRGEEGSVEIKEKDGYKNIRKIYSFPNLEVTQVQGGVNIGPKVNVVDKDRHIRAGVAMRFAVDLCVAGKIEFGQITTTATGMLSSMQKLAE